MNEVDLKADVEAGLEAALENEGGSEIAEEVITEVVQDWSDEEAAEAEAMGWIPPERAGKLPEGKKFKGPQEYMQANPLYRKMKEMESTMGQLNSHYQKVSETEQKKAAQQYEATIAQLKADKVQALDEANHTKVVEIDEQIRTTEKPVEEKTVNGEAIIADWVNNGNEWYEKDSFLKVEAEKTAQAMYSDKLYGIPLLDAVKDHLKEAYPQRFGNPNRQKAAAVDSGNAAPKSSGSKVSVKDLTRDERDVYENFKRMNVFKTDAEVKKYLAEVIESRD